MKGVSWLSRPVSIMNWSSATKVTDDLSNFLSVAYKNAVDAKIILRTSATYQLTVQSQMGMVIPTP